MDQVHSIIADYLKIRPKLLLEYYEHMSAVLSEALSRFDYIERYFELAD
jgi:hypothetical protein